MRTIAESLAEHGAESQDPDALTARARIALGATIVSNINGLEDSVEAIVLDPPLERLLHQGIQGSSNGAAPMEPGLAERIHKSLCDIANQREVEGKSTVLLVADAIRPFLARFVRGSIQGLHVLSFNEIPDNQQIKVVATVGG
jgi:flagellar biosynthesis protein FlhA